jgi:hypothetical protein
MGSLRAISIGLLVLILPVLCAGQSLEKSAFKNIQKKKWAKAEASLRKSLKKDSVNSLARYLLSYSFFRNDNPAYHLDSAYSYSLHALADFRLTSNRERSKLKRFPFDSVRIISLRKKIDSVAFQNAVSQNTEAAYIEFLQKHPLDLTHAGQAIEMRNEVAYQNALRENSYQALMMFMNKYPESIRVAEARIHYDRLLYESLTHDRRLSTFESFLAEYPATPFRVEIEQNIFDLTTLAGDEQSFLKYLKRYPKSPHAKRAKNILFHLLLDAKTTDWPDDFLTDSLLHVIKLQQSFILPFLKNGKFGFMNSDGLQVMKPELTDLPAGYTCEYFFDDFIVLEDGILTRDGRAIFTGKPESVDDIGKGFLKIKSNGCFSILHKSGFVAYPCVTDAKTVDHFMAVKSDSLWSLYALSGRKMINESFDDISAIGKVFAFRKAHQVQLTSKANILQAAEVQTVLKTDSVEQARLLESALIWIKTEHGEGIVDQNLKEIIPVKHQRLLTSSFGMIGKTREGYNLYSLSHKFASSFENVIDKRPWLAVKKDAQWYLLNATTFDIESEGYDSVGFQGAMFIGAKHDTLTVHFTKSSPVKFAQPVEATFLPGKDSTAFLIVQMDKKKMLYNSAGVFLFAFTYDQIQHAGKNLFIITKNDKKGLIGPDGKIILPPEYDAIGSISGNTISLLKNLKFGMYHIGTKKLIKPQYDKNIIALSPSTFLAFKDKGYGFIASDGKPVGKFEYDEIQNWNDSTAWLRQNSLWSLINLRSRRVLTDDVEEIRVLEDSPEEKRVIVKQHNAYGVISNKRGTVIPISFSDLVILGPSDEPIYFTEKHVAEASIFVVIYYDANGKLIRREVYEDPNEYEKIYCSDN